MSTVHETKTNIMDGMEFRTTIERKGFCWSNLLLGIMFLMVAIIAFRHPAANLIAIAMVFGLMAIVSGTWFIATRFGSNIRLLGGILEITIGVILLFNIGLTAAMIPFVFAIWFIADSISNLFLLRYIWTFGQRYFWFTLIMSLIGIALGVLLLFHPIISVLTLSFMVGLYFVLVGIEYITIAFSSKSTRIPDGNR